MSNESKLSPSAFLAELKQQLGGSSKSEQPGESADPADRLNSLVSDLRADLRSQKSESPRDVDSEIPSAADVRLNPPLDVTTSEDPLAELTAGEESAPDEKSPTGENGDVSEIPEDIPELSELFARVHDLLGDEDGEDAGEFRPKIPRDVQETGLTNTEIEQLILKILFSYGQLSGRAICGQLKLPFPIVEPLLKAMKQDQLIQFKGTAAIGDYEFAITDLGRDRARRYMEESGYIGAAPVALRDYLQAMEHQSIAKQEATEADLEEAFSDLIIAPEMLERLGPAVNSGRGMFLFGEPGNGKTSIAERVTGCFGSTIWIPRALGVHGEIIRLFDPGVHEEVEMEVDDGIIDRTGIDQRWVQIVRPTVVAGGELTMDALEVAQNKDTKVCEAPLQLKSNCGTLVIDDFGRQRMPVAELLNRWIVPLEKRYDFLNLPSGKKVQVPFDQLIVFSTNLEPNDLVDGAFLRRIPYKIEVPDPTEAQFKQLCGIIAPHMGFEFCEKSVDYLIETHYRPTNRPFRSCQPRDLLLQVRNYCVYKTIPKRMTPEAFDFAVENYFSVM